MFLEILLEMLLEQHVTRNTTNNTLLEIYINQHHCNLQANDMWQYSVLTVRQQAAT